MTNISITQTTLCLIASCSLTLLVAAGAGTAFAHGGGGHSGGDHPGNSGHGRCIDCGTGKWGGGSWSAGGGRHHHHHHRTMSGKAPLHGPGSSHNPIVYHPVHGPGSSHNPIVAPVTVVRDHRRPPPHYHRPLPYCSQQRTTECKPVRDHRGS